MKKTISLLLSILLICSVCLLAGCSEEEKTNNDPIEETTDVQATPEGSSSPADLSSDDSTATALSENETKKEAIKVNYTDLYNSVLKETYNYIVNFDDSDEIPFGNHGIAEIARNSDKPSEALTRVGYYTKDLNKDGIPELLIGSCDDEAGEGISIFAIYTCVDGNAKLLDEGWYRSRYYPMNNGSLFYYGSSGASYQSFGTYGIADNLKSLKCTKFYFSDLKDGKQVFYTNTTGEEDPSASKEINSETFWNEYDKLMDRTVEFKLTTLSKLK